MRGRDPLCSTASSTAVSNKIHESNQQTSSVSGTKHLKTSRLRSMSNSTNTCIFLKVILKFVRNHNLNIYCRRIRNKAFLKFHQNHLCRSSQQVMKEDAVPHKYASANIQDHHGWEILLICKPMPIMEHLWHQQGTYTLSSIQASNVKVSYINLSSRSLQQLV